MRAFAIAVGANADDVPSGKRTLVDTGRRDPNVSLIISDRQIAAGHGGEFFVVDPLHKHYNLICGVNVLNIHDESSL